LNRILSTDRTGRNRLQSTSKRKPLWLLFFFALVLAGYFLLDTGLFVSKNSDPAPPEKQASLSSNDEDVASAPAQVETSPQEAPSQRVEKTLSVSSGDTLMGLLVKAGLGRAEAHTVITSLEEVFNPRRLRRGQEINLTFAESPEQEVLFHSLNLKVDIAREVQVERCEENGFVSMEIVHELETRPVLVEAKIESSLYVAAVKAGVPLEVLVQMIRAYSFDIDFQRDIQPGDEFSVVYQEEENRRDQVARGGAVLYSSLTTGGRALRIYRYETSDGKIDFFDPEGKSVGKTLMITPIDGARLSSGYGKRRHPILGYSRMHRGLDFAAPTGTPIMAAGDGVVELAARKGNYGNYIRIRHPNEYHTVYAHLSRFGKGVRRGTRVTQGQIIGFVGSTGLSTGPHLHYEVHHRGRPVNPSALDFPPTRILEGHDLEGFTTAKKELETLLASLQGGDRLALAEEGR
jgi:murein DD-endopeptidase MepM/ murein hydrolase activator NlpD